MPGACCMLPVAHCLLPILIPCQLTWRAASYVNSIAAILAEPRCCRHHWPHATQVGKASG